MLKLTKQKRGNVLRVYIQGDNEKDIRERYYSFYNHSATDEDLCWIKSSLAHFSTTEKRLKKSLISSSLFRILNESPYKFKKKKQGAILAARLEADERFSAIEELIIDSTKNIFKVNEYKCEVEEPVEMVDFQ